MKWIRLIILLGLLALCSWIGFQAWQMLQKHNHSLQGEESFMYIPSGTKLPDFFAMVENHHNFAWKEVINGQELIVHRKGATPAQKNVLGIIPGSMTAPGYIVKGKGNEQSLSSASHGAGRVLSRAEAKRTLTRSDLKKVLKNHGVTLIGAGMDEAPMAYKDINRVMAHQTDLIDVVGMFTPKIVRMDKG